MNILITGGTGLIGKHLVKKLNENKHSVRILTRKETNRTNEFYWNIDEDKINQKAFENLDSIIHLAGANIGKRWTKTYKKELYNSRIDTANFLFENCKKLNVKLKSFISASGINYYGTFTSNQILSEKDSIIKPDFLANLCDDWEKSAHQFQEISERVVCLRTAMVLAKDGGSFPLLKKITNLNLASAVGSGKQWMNWIHMEDLINMYLFSVENKKISGNYNAVADEVLINKYFMKILTKVQHKLFLPINVPSIFLKMAFGEMSLIILEGTLATNQKIKSDGFDFKYNHLEVAFKSLVK